MRKEKLPNKCKKCGCILGFHNPNKCNMEHGGIHTHLPVPRGIRSSIGKMF